MLTAFQLFLLLQHSFSAAPEHLADIALGFCSLIVMEWSCYNAMRIINRSGFEIETVAFFLSSLGMSVAASSTPSAMQGTSMDSARWMIASRSREAF